MSKFTQILRVDFHKFTKVAQKIWWPWNCKLCSLYILSDYVYMHERSFPVHSKCHPEFG